MTFRPLNSVVYYNGDTEQAPGLTKNESRARCYNFSTVYVITIFLRRLKFYQQECSEFRTLQVCRLTYRRFSL